MLSEESKLVSIIIPYFNRIKYVNNAINSILNQTYRNWEIILIDDSSNEEGVIQSQDKRIHYFRNRTNLGPGASRQKGLELSSGEMICFLDSDDVYLPTFLQKNLEIHFANNLNLAFSYCITNWENGKTYKSSNHKYVNILPYLLTSNRPWHTSSLFWNREFITKWHIDIRTWEDYLFEFEVALGNNNIEFLDEVLCIVHLDEENGLSQNAEKKDGVTDRLKALVYMQQKLNKVEIVSRKVLIRNIKNRINKELIKLSKIEIKFDNYLNELKKLNLIKNPLHFFLLKISYGNVGFYKIIMRVFS